MRWEKPGGLRNKAQVSFCCAFQINPPFCIHSLLCITGKHQEVNTVFLPLQSLPTLQPTHFHFILFILDRSQKRPLPAGITSSELCNCLSALTPKQLFIYSYLISQYRWEVRVLCLSEFPLILAQYFLNSRGSINKLVSWLLQYTPRY